MRLFQVALLVVGTLALPGRSHSLAQDVEPVPVPGSASSHLRIHNTRIDEVLIPCVVAQLAHELYHALEIAREPDVVDAASVVRLYERIGEPSCSDPTAECHETRAALAFEALVVRQVASPPRASAASDR